MHWRRFGRGPGPPVLMIHGGPGLTSRYLDLLAGLADGRPVYTWDQLDCGRSDCPHDPALWVLERFVDELDAVRNALTPGPVHVFGHSWGATLGVEWLVTRRPSNVASVVFASPWPRRSPLDTRHARTDRRTLARGTVVDRDRRTDWLLHDTRPPASRLGRMDAGAHHAYPEP